jgi:hypothetical protein
LVSSCRLFKGVWCLHLHGQAVGCLLLRWSTKIPWYIRKYWPNNRVHKDCI